MFTLHGPVDTTTERLRRFDFTIASSLSGADKRMLGGGTEMERRFVRQLQRYQQDVFRANLLEAYGFQCAICDANVPEGLQVAHIEPYRGVQSQHTSNGLLLRADLHLLYDAHLLSVTPEEHVVRLSDKLRDTPYRRFNGSRIRTPQKRSDRPSDNMLEKQYRQFASENRVLELD